MGENTFGAAFGGLDELAVVDHGGPMRRHGLGVALGLPARGAVSRPPAARLERYAPLGGERVLVDLVFAAIASLLEREDVVPHCTTISLNSTALIRFGAIEALTRRVSSSLSR